MRPLLAVASVLLGCAAPRPADLPTAAEVERAVAASFGDPAAEMDFTDRAVLVRTGVHAGSPPGSPWGDVLPALVHWQRTAQGVPLVLGPWKLRVLPYGEYPEGTVCLYEIDCDGGHGFEGVFLCICAMPLDAAARATARAANRTALPTAAEVDEAVALAFGPPAGEIDEHLDFTGRMMVFRIGQRDGYPVVVSAALPSLFRWLHEAPRASLWVRDWELSLRSFGERPEGTLCLYEFCSDGEFGFELNVCAMPKSRPARALVQRLRRA